MSKIALTPSATGTGVFTISSPATNTDRTLTLPDEAGTVLTSASSIPTSALTGNITQNAGPAFSAYQNTTSGSIATATLTKLLFDTELWDTNSNFSSSRFTPTVAGYYQINSTYQIAPVASGFMAIYKNGGLFKRGFWSSSTMQQFNVSGIVFCNGSTDFIEVYIYQTSGSSVQPQGGADLSWFDGVLVRAA